MRIDILTLFPSMFLGPFDDSLMARAKSKGLVDIHVSDLRDFGLGERRSVDDRPYGGGVGMIMMVEPIDKALEKLKTKSSKVILTTPRGKKFTQKSAEKLSQEKHLIFVCGRYEGFDERVHEHFVDEEYSVGDFVMMGGELPTMLMVETVTRLIPGVIEKEEALVNESFSDPSKLEFAQYTRPPEYKGFKVPDVLLSGDHKKIEAWRQESAIIVTEKMRPDLHKLQLSYNK